MEIRVIHDVTTVYELLKTRVSYNYIYQLDALSAKVWNKVICYGLFDDSTVKEIAMLFINYDIPVLLAANFENKAATLELITKIKDFLPSRFYTHMDREILEHVFDTNQLSHMEEYMNMGLCDDGLSNTTNHHPVIQLGFQNLTQIKDLLAISYPEAWFNDELVNFNKNFGMMMDGKLVSFAGIHAYSEEYQVVALAHITTHPDYRKKGYCEKALSALINDLKGNIKFIGLNVKVNNIPAIYCYKKLGFKEFGHFIACEVTNNK